VCKIAPDRLINLGDHALSLRWREFCGQRLTMGSGRQTLHQERNRAQSDQDEQPHAASTMESTTADAGGLHHRFLAQWKFSIVFALCSLQVALPSNLDPEIVDFGKFLANFRNEQLFCVACTSTCSIVGGYDRAGA
jgi:hypothetical protein